MRVRGVALGGFMGVGKSAVGRALALSLGLDFVDLDEVLEDRYGPITSQFEAVGETGFRSRERGLIAEFCDGTPRVIATGGGAWVDPINRVLLGQDHVMVVLSAGVQTLRTRIGSDPSRPLWNDSAAALLASRAEAYADADVHLATDDLSLEAVVRALVARLSGRLASTDSSVLVPLARRSYPVVLRDDWSGLADQLRRLGLDQWVVVADPEASRLHGQALRAELGTVRWIDLEGSERNKSQAALAALLDQLLIPGFHRKTAILAFGGGVTGDLAGLAAATAMRGVPYVQLPTTLLAMVDSSVGGKTAVNTAAGKNLVGAFYQPSLVWAALCALETLSARELRCGLGEVLKTALVGDAELLELLEREAVALGNGTAPRALWAQIVRRCVEIKAEIVAGDERESGRRAVLNLGHTVAHGLERALGPEALGHGQAVAIGLVLEARWAAANGWCVEPDLPAKIERIALAMGLPVSLPMTERDAVCAAMRLDKKASSDSLLLPVPVRAGLVSLVHLPISAIGDLLTETG